MGREEKQNERDGKIISLIDMCGSPSGSAKFGVSHGPDTHGPGPWRCMSWRCSINWFGPHRIKRQHLHVGILEPRSKRCLLKPS